MRGIAALIIACLTLAGDIQAQEIIIDNLPPGQSSSSVSTTGTWTTSQGGLNPYGVNGSLYSSGPSLDTYRWTPTIPAAGRYAVYVWWTSTGNRSAATAVTVQHTEGQSTRQFDQRVGGGQWVLHGSYLFTAGTSGHVQVSDVNGEACADAVRFVPEAGGTTPTPTSALTPTPASTPTPAAGGTAAECYNSPHPGPGTHTFRMCSNQFYCSPDLVTTLPSPATPYIRWMFQPITDPRIMNIQAYVDGNQIDYHVQLTKYPCTASGGLRAPNLSIQPSL